MSLRVLIADDHAPTRAGVRSGLEQAGHEVRGEVSTAEAAVEVAVRECPDVCLLDIEMPGGGIWAAAQISARAPDVRIVILTVSLAESDFFDALRAGSIGYLHKEMDPAGLPGAVEAAAAGEGVLDGVLVAALIEEFRRGGSEHTTINLDHSHRVDLTPREWEVLDMLADGLTTAEIARRLLISQLTVRRHVSILMQKLEVTTREDLRALVSRRSA